MTKKYNLPRTLFVSLVCCSLLFLTACPDDDDPFANPNDPLGLYGTPAFITVETDTDTSTFTMKKDASGKIESIKDDQGVESPVAYTGNSITGIGQTYSAKVNGDGLYTETSLDFGAFKSTTEWIYDAEGNLTSLITLHSIKQSDGSFSTDTAAMISNIVFGAQNEGSFLYTTYNVGLRYTSYQGSFKWIDRGNSYQSFGPYAMMLELTDQFNGFFNCGYKECISSLELVNLSNGNTTSFDIQYQFDTDGNIIERTITTSQSGVTGTIRHFFGF